MKVGGHTEDPIKSVLNSNLDFGHNAQNFMALRDPFQVHPVDL